MPAAIRNAVNDLQGIRKQPWQHEFTYSGRIKDTVQRYGNVHDEIDKMTLFVNGLLPSVQTIVGHFRESKDRSRLSYEDVVQYAQHEGKSH